MGAAEIVAEAVKLPPELWVQIVGFATSVGVTTGQTINRLVTAYERR